MRTLYRTLLRPALTGILLPGAALTGILLPGAALTGLFLPGPAGAAQPFEQRIPVEPGGRLEVEIDAGDVQIEGHDQDEVRIDARAAGMGSRGVEFELEHDEEEVRLEADFGGLSALFARPRVRVRIWVPDRFDVEVETDGGSVDVERVHGDLRVQTSGGAVRVERLRGAVELETSGGPIRARDVQGDLQAQTSGGRIRGSDITGRVEAETSGGPIDLTDVGGPVHAQTSGGSISVRFTHAPAGQMETSGGGIKVEFATGAGADLQAESRGGRVDVEPALELSGGSGPGRVEGRINGGGPSLQLRASGGNIRIRER